MELNILKNLGLTSDQIKTYATLLDQGAMSPPQLADKTGDSRTNAYMALKKLADIGLAVPDPSKKKLTYLPLNPAHLDTLIARRERDLQIARAELQNRLPELLDTYYTNVQRPTARYYEGRDALSKIYQDQLASGNDVFSVHTAEDIDRTLLADIAAKYLPRIAEAGISTNALTPNYPAMVADSKKNDKKLRRKITWYDPSQYSAPVEISVWGNKVAFVLYGDDVVATVIDSPAVAQAMRDMFEMARGGAKGRRFL